jgi:hypothetical protein
MEHFFIKNRVGSAVRIVSPNAKTKQETLMPESYLVLGFQFIK